jgi:Flp pilus assembly protein TadB
MKFPSLFVKTPRHKRFNFMPRYYNPQEEEAREREARVRKELLDGREVQDKNEGLGYRTRIAGSFRQARRRTPQQADLSAGILRLAILLFLVLWLILFLEFGVQSAYILLLLIPLYLFFKLRRQ